MHRSRYRYNKDDGNLVSFVFQKTRVDRRRVEKRLIDYIVKIQTLPLKHEKCVLNF